jgi:hypothetical protein
MKKTTIPQQAVVFGSDLIATNWALKNDVPRENVVLATNPDAVAALEGPVTVVRVPEEEWEPYAFSDQNRVKDTEELLKEHKKAGDEIVVEETNAEELKPKKPKKDKTDD